MNGINRANTNSLWSSVLVETLSKCGIDRVVVSPGSRSTPLTVAFASHPSIEAIPVLDERSAAFFALGIAKRTHRAVALVCTSGTAAVNYFPAVVEASEARIPLLVLTADRPPELRDCGAGQTINQLRLYGDYPVYQTELDLPDVTRSALERLREGLVAACTHAQWGPVHLNCPFRDPLPPIADASTRDAPEISDAFFEDLQVSSRTSKRPDEPIPVDTARGIIICGTEAPENPLAYCEQVSLLSKTSGWPVLADGLSPVRNYAKLQSKLVTTYDLLLRIESFHDSMKPDCVIALGPLPTSKALRAWLSEADTKLYHINRTGKNLDPTGSVTEVLDVAVEDILGCFTFGELVGSDYAGNWVTGEAAARSVLDASFDHAKANHFEGFIAWSLPQWLPEGTPVFVASSMPVRDMEYFLPPNDRKLEVLASRGANGIDGTLSTALGMAHGNKPAVLLTGDLAFLHDSNGLLVRPHFTGHLTVILVNNHGGGIFNHLPIAEFEPPFESFFATPQEVDFRRLVESCGCSYEKVRSIGELGELLSKLPESGIRVIEVETDRNQDSEYRKNLFKKICNSL